MHSNELRLLSTVISTLCVVRTLADLDEDHKQPPSFVAQFFHGTHVRTAPHQHPPWNEYANNSKDDDGDGDDDEDDYKPLLDTSNSEDEGRTNSTTVRHSSEQQTGYDSSDEDDRDTRRRNYFLIQQQQHRAKKQRRTKTEQQRFVWRPFTPSFLINFEPYAPVSPLLLSKWSRKPNDILLVVLQQRRAASPTPSADARCTCGSSQNETFASATSGGGSIGDDLRKERNESSSSTSSSVVDEPHLTAANWPSSCVFAIVACCSPNNYHLRYGCFPHLGCSIAFWDTDPCQISIMVEAARQAHTYYTQLAVDGNANAAANYPGSDEEEGVRGSTSARTPSSTTTTTSTTSPTPTPTPTTTTTTTTTTGATSTLPPTSSVSTTIPAEQTTATY